MRVREKRARGSRHKLFVKTSTIEANFVVVVVVFGEVIKEKVEMVE